LYTKNDSEGRRCVCQPKILLSKFDDNMTVIKVIFFTISH